MTIGPNIGYLKGFRDSFSEESIDEGVTDSQLMTVQSISNVQSLLTIQSVSSISNVCFLPCLQLRNRNEKQKMEESTESEKSIKMMRPYNPKICSFSSANFEGILSPSQSH